jgi:phage-related protein
MNRKHWLIGLAVALIGAKVVSSIYSSWGLITIHADNLPLQKVISQVQRQGHITLKTDLDPQTKVTMHVTKVPLTEALDTLSAVTDARWRLRYFLAADKAAIRTALDSLTAGTKPEGWKLIDHPMPPMFAAEDDALPDPRRDLWTIKTPEENTLSAYLEGAARSTNAGFVFPETWNPSIRSAPRSAEIARVIPKLAGSVGGKYEELFVLVKPERRQWQQGEQAQADGPQDRERRPDWMADRAQAEINKLPPDKRAEAQAEFDKQRALWQEVRNLPPDQRRAKMQEFFNDPKMQARRDEREAARDAKHTPDQRFQRYQQYVARKLAAQQQTGQKQ